MDGPVGIADADEQLVVHPPGGEAAEAVDDGCQSDGGQSSCHCSHVRLRYAYVVEAVGELLLKGSRTDTGGKVGIHDDDIVMLPAQIDHRSDDRILVVLECAGVSHSLSSSLANSASIASSAFSLLICMEWLAFTPSPGMYP